ncbi:alpha-methylacyl-CoA racemase [Aureococcus anophagefferens]|nr:alpha-methylacyl-CoA racemase [Aureococcus anophagefferens]
MAFLLADPWSPRAGELQRDLAAQQLVDDLHAWLRRSGCTEVSCADLVPFYGAFPRYRKGGGQGSGIKHAIVRFGGAKLSWVEAAAARDRPRARRRRGPGPPPPPAYAPFAAPPPFAPPPPPPPSPPGLGADDDAAARPLACSTSSATTRSRPSRRPSGLAAAVGDVDGRLVVGELLRLGELAVGAAPRPSRARGAGLSRLQPPTTPWDQAAERYRPLDVGFAPFRLPAPSREEPCPT